MSEDTRKPSGARNSADKGSGQRGWNKNRGDKKPAGKRGFDKRGQGRRSDDDGKPGQRDFRGKGKPGRGGAGGGRGPKREGRDFDRRKPAQRRWNSDRDEAKRDTYAEPATESAQIAESESQQDRPRKWVPNRERKQVQSKKDFDQKKMAHLVDDDKPVYHGELDPREKDPNRKPRSISRSEELVRRKAEALAEKDPSLQARRETKITDFRDQFERCEASPGRLAALYATQQVRRRDAFAQEVIESTIDRSTISKQDRAFATLLTLGVVSTSGSLDEVINRCIASPRDIKSDVRDAMRISTYEIIYLRKAPHAALDQGVELVRAVAPSASGLANAVLHRVLAAAEDFPFGDPTVSIDALALTYAFPTWLARKLIEDMGSAAAIDLMRSANDQAPVHLHVNSLQATDEEVLAVFEDTKSPLVPAEAGGVSVPGCYQLNEARLLADGRVRRLFQQGKILVSDAAAQAVAACVLEGDKPGSVLEVGAGRGTKTIMLQSLANLKFGDQLALTSMDNIAFKSDLLRDRARDYGVKLDQIVTGNATRLDYLMPDQYFDTIFIDAPCSGLGTLRRHHEIRWRVSQNRIDELAETGLALLKSAAGHVNPGGSIVYATCTVTYAENNGVVKSFLESEEGSAYALAPINGKSCFSTQQAPGTPDAHFAARFIRK